VTLEQQMWVLQGTVWVLIFLMGGTVASALRCFLNRLVHGRRWSEGRSKCENCGHVLNWVDLIPVIGCLLRRGKCHYCKAYFGYSHAVSEAAMGLLFVAVALVLFPDLGIQ